MDYTAILSRMEGMFSGPGGALLVAALGVLGIVGAHILRMKYGSARRHRATKSYRNVVIAPYREESGMDPQDAMMPKFPPEPDRL